MNSNFTVLLLLSTVIVEDLNMKKDGYPFNI